MSSQFRLVQPTYGLVCSCLQPAWPAARGCPCGTHSPGAAGAPLASSLVRQCWGWWAHQPVQGLLRFPCPENPGREKYDKPTPLPALQPPARLLVPLRPHNQHVVLIQSLWPPAFPSSAPCCAGVWMRSSLSRPCCQLTTCSQQPRGSLGHSSSSRAGAPRTQPGSCRTWRHRWACPQACATVSVL